MHVFLTVNEGFWWVEGRERLDDNISIYRKVEIIRKGGILCMIYIRLCFKVYDLCILYLQQLCWVCVLQINRVLDYVEYRNNKSEETFKGG